MTDSDPTPARRPFDGLREQCAAVALTALESVCWPDGEPYLHMRESMRKELAGAAADAVIGAVVEHIAAHFDSQAEGRHGWMPNAYRLAAREIRSTYGQR